MPEDHPSAQRLQLQVIVLDDRIGSEFELPSFATAGAAAIDLRAMTEENITLAPGETMRISTGLRIYIEDTRYAGLILPRSGLGWREGIVLGNLVGVLDADYQGPLLIPCWNRSDESREIHVGQRIAQLMIVPVTHFDLVQVSEFSNQTERGQSGFGSTGSH